MANERFTARYGKCTVNDKEGSIHCREQEKLVHPAAGSHTGNETPLWPASPCAPRGTARSSCSPCCHGSAPHRAHAPLSCAGKREAGSLGRANSGSNTTQTRGLGGRKQMQ